MQTLQFVPRPEKRHRIALETLEIYAPLAERIGMHDMKDMLQDLSFKELYPQARESILTRLEYLRENGGSLKNDIVRQLQEDLREAEVSAVVYGREKKPYSIWRKMQKKNITLEQLSDVMAFRVIVDSVAQCYAALGIIHSQYTIIPGRFKDYISMPKANGYQSLHTTVIGPRGHRIEVQIRTNDMHEVAELGVAAHWVYKQGKAQEGAQYTWLRDLLDVLDTASSPEEFLEHTKMSMFQDQVFCFSPKGDLVALPKDSTPVDFAYAVHSEVGHACVGAKVNGRIVPLRTALKNGDQVDIITQKGHQPSPSWEEFVVSAKAKSHIRRFVRQQRRNQYVELGKALLQKAFKDAGRPYSENSVVTVLEKFKSPSYEELLVNVGEGQLSGRDVLVAVYPEILKAEALLRQDAVPIPKKKKASKASLPIKGLIAGMAMHYAKCCHPVPGDRIVGIVTTGKGVTIHTIDCDSLSQFQDQPHRWIDVSWEEQRDDAVAHVSRLHIIMENEPGNLGSMCTIIGQNQANIHNLKIVNRSYDLYELLIDVEVKDARHIAMIMAALRANRGINAVERAKS
jgi:GTP pyrophosphokinase